MNYSDSYAKSYSAPKRYFTSYGFVKSNGNYRVNYHRLTLFNYWIAYARAAFKFITCRLDTRAYFSRFFWELRTTGEKSQKSCYNMIWSRKYVSFIFLFVVIHVMKTRAGHSPFKTDLFLYYIIFLNIQNIVCV